MSEQQQDPNAPYRRPGFRYRRSVGESLVREVRAFEKELGTEIVLSHVRVSFIARDGEVLAECTLVEAMHAVQFNEHTLDGARDVSAAFAVEVYVVA